MSARVLWRRSKSHSYKSAQVQIALAKFKSHRIFHYDYLLIMNMEIKSLARGSTNSTVPSFSLGQTYKIEGNNNRTKHFQAFIMFLCCDYIICVLLPPYSCSLTAIFACFDCHICMFCFDSVSFCCSTMFIAGSAKKHKFAPTKRTQQKRQDRTERKGPTTSTI